VLLTIPATKDQSQAPPHISHETRAICNIKSSLPEVGNVHIAKELLDELRVIYCLLKPIRSVYNTNVIMFGTIFLQVEQQRAYQTFTKTTRIINLRLLHQK
jgi:hypothetical protein